MLQVPSISITSVIDRRPLGSFRIGILLVCFLVVLMDGFDTQAIGFAAPGMSASLAIPITDFGKVFSAGLLGAMLGAFVLGPLGDRVGRRWMLASAVFVFSLFSLLTPRAPDLPWLMLVRFFAGLGLGGAIPNLLALSSGYAPRRMRGLLTGVLFAGFPLGGAIGALTSEQLLPLFGWPALFYIGGTIPLLLSVAVVSALPESLEFLLRQRNGQVTVRAIIRRIAPDALPDAAIYVAAEEQIANLAVRHLFSAGRAAPTLLLWAASFMCFLLLIVLGLWTPALLRSAGVGGTPAALVAALANLGSVAGTAIGGRLIDRFAPYLALPSLFVAGAFAVGLLANAIGSVLLLALFAALSGFFLGAASSGLLGVAVSIYPSLMRATGVGWTMALGRMGQVMGPLAIGALLADGLAINIIFLCCAAPALCAASATFMLRWSGLRASFSRHHDCGRHLNRMLTRRLSRVLHGRPHGPSNRTSSPLKGERYDRQ